MVTEILAAFYERDLRLLMDELNRFSDEADLWRVTGSVKNSAGNLTLHLIGGMNHHIGATLAQTGYVRHRDLEFSQKNVPRSALLAQLEALIGLINQTLGALGPQDLEAEFPAFFDQPGSSVQYVLIQLLAHLNYHRGQVNYLRRTLS